MHCNDSRDAAGSGPTTPISAPGNIDPQLLAAVVKAADAPVICETADEGRKDDIAFLREIPKLIWSRVRAGVVKRRLATDTSQV